MKESTTIASSKPIHITEHNKFRLEKLIIAAQRDFDFRDDLSSLSAELARATIIDSGKIPKNVVTMNSQVTLIDLDTAERLTFFLVFPENADPEEGRFSVLAPIGTGVLGYRTGDEFEWDVPAGKRRFKIAKVTYQPGAKRHFHL